MKYGNFPTLCKTQIQYFNLEMLLGIAKKLKGQKNRNEQLSLILE